jgi:hypothetical protein
LLTHRDYYLFPKNSSTVIPACLIKLLNKPGASSL